MSLASRAAASPMTRSAWLSRFAAMPSIDQ
jgi:hypothetical protein